MAYQSIRQRMAELDRRLLSAERYLPYRLEVYTHNLELLYNVGGELDTTGYCYTGNACTARQIVLKPDQEEIGRGIAKYVEQRCANDDTRKALIMAIGERGGGKTFLASLMIVTVALMLPGSWSMAVSIFSAQNEEIRIGIDKICPPGWYEQVLDPKEPGLAFLNGSRCRWFTSRAPLQMRQGAIDWELVVINEGQDQPEEVATNGVAVVRNRGGVVFVATNPPMEDDGDWVAILHQGLKADPTDGESYEVKAAQNDSVNQRSREKSIRLTEMINPERAAADGLGRIKLSGDVAYQGFTRQARIVDADGNWLSGHVCEPDESWDDETELVTAIHAKTAFGYAAIGGCDWQTEPGCCAPLGRLYRESNGLSLLYITEFVGVEGTEADLTMALTARRYYPGSLDYDDQPAIRTLLIGDATGARQSASHRPEPYSFKQVQADGWKVLPPDYVGKKRTPWNPSVNDSRKQMKLLLTTGRIAFSSKCAEAIAGFPSLLDSMQRCKVNAVGKFIKKKHYTHGPDGVRYIAWRFMPRGEIPVPKPRMNRGAVETLARIKINGG